MDFFAKGYYSSLRSLFLVVGIWPYHQTLVTFIQRVTIGLFSVACFVSQAVAIFKEGNDANTIVKEFTICTGMLIISIKIISMRIKLDKVKQLLEWIQYNWKCYACKEEQNILHEYASKSQLFTRVYFLAHVFLSLVAVLLQLMPHILDIVVPLNHTRPEFTVAKIGVFIDREQHQFFVLLQTGVIFLIGSYVSGAFESLYVVCILHICGICHILSFQFKKLFPETGIHECMNSRKCVLRKQIRECIKSHELLISVTSDVNEFFTIGFGCGFFVVIICSTIVLFQLYKALVIMHDKEQVSMFSLFLVIIAGNTFIISYPGQMLLDASSDMFDEICSARWYTACVTVQRMLIPVIQRCREPLAVYIADYIKLSSETFAKLLNMPFSYFMVLYSVYQKDDV